MASEREKLIWDTWNTEHIKKHAVSVKEVEEAYRSQFAKKKSYHERIVIFGETKNRRLLTIICSQEKQEDYYVVSARDMSRKERRLYYEQTNTN